MNDRRMAIAAAIAKNLQNHLPTAAADFCTHNKLPVELEVPLAVFAAEMVRYGIQLAKAADRMTNGGEPDCVAA